MDKAKLEAMGNTPMWKDLIKSTTYVKAFTRETMDGGLPTVTKEFNDSHAQEIGTALIEGKGLPILSALLLINKWNLSIRFRYRALV